MQNANECRHEYRQGLALVPINIKPDVNRETVGYSDFIFALRSCNKCRFCGKSVGGDVKHGS